MTDRHLDGWIGNRADSPIALPITDELAAEYVNSAAYDAEGMLGRSLAVWLAGKAGRNIAWDPSIPSNQAAFDDLYERVRIIERAREATSRRSVELGGDPLTTADVSAARISAYRREQAALDQARAAGLDPIDADDLAGNAGPILLPIRLTWLDQFPAEPVEIRAYDDGERILVDEVDRDHMVFTLEEAMPLDVDTARELRAMAPDRNGRYDVTEALGGREHAMAVTRPAPRVEPPAGYVAPPKARVINESAFDDALARALAAAESIAARLGDGAWLVDNVEYGDEAHMARIAAALAAVEAELGGGRGPS